MRLELNLEEKVKAELRKHDGQKPSPTVKLDEPETFAAALGYAALPWLGEPTRAGWWWWYGADEKWAIKVYVVGRRNDIMCVVPDCQTRTNELVSVADYRGRWAGPAKSEEALGEEPPHNDPSSATLPTSTDTKTYGK